LDKLAFSGPMMNVAQTCALRSIDGRATAPDERFGRLIRLARRHVGTAMAFITQLDAHEHLLTSCDGFPFGEPPSCLSFYAGAAMGDDVLVVPDAAADERFHDHPLVTGYPHVRFYVGCPLLTAAGSRVGVLCLLGNQPQSLSDEQLEFLRDVASLAASIIERDKAEARLADEGREVFDSERRMALALAGSGTGVWDRNVQTDEIYYSPGWKAILGYSEAELSNRITDSYKRLHPGDLAYVQATIQEHFDQKTPSYEVEHRIQCKDGTYKWVSSRGKVVSRDSEGRPLRMIGTTTDITAMRAMSEKLQQTVDLITNLTNEVPGLVFQYRLLPGGESFFSYASAGIRDIYELEPQQVATSAAALDALIHPDDLSAYRNSLAVSAARLSPWHLEYRVQLPGQGLRWRQGDARPQRLEDGGTLWHGFITDVTQRKSMDAELHERATTDFLTRLPNRGHFMEQMDAELARIKRDSSRCAAVLMCDLDHFKSINDTQGHAVGDMALKHFARILRDHLRKTDVAGRVGGEEFAVMLRGADFPEAVAFARRLQQQIAQTPLLLANQCIAITVSVGVAIMTASDADSGFSLFCSDSALYQAKARGRNRIECYGAA
jgi:diguanylate cyclase (GGDEF)-like protein/PAS domain S-box-containing protein